MKKEKEIMLGVTEEEEKNMVELMGRRAIVELPEDAVQVDLECVVYHDDQLIKVSRKLDMSALREAFRKADDGYIDEDDTFVLTEKGKKYLQELRNDC